MEPAELKTLLDVLDRVGGSDDIEVETGVDEPIPTVLVAAFEGFSDAGEAASSALQSLAVGMDATVCTRIKDNDYYDYQFMRPVVVRRRGKPTHLWPQTDFLIARFQDENQKWWRLLLVTGQEPNFRWREYCAEVLTVAADHNVKAVVVLGSALADTPHTRPLPAHLSSEDEQLRHLMAAEQSDYEGPTGITGILAYTAHQSGLPTLSLWVDVPHYAAHPPVPPATLVLLEGLKELLGLPLDTHSVRRDAEAWIRGANQLMQEDEELAEHIRRLQISYDDHTMTTPEDRGIAEELANEVERFLRRQRPQ